MQLRRDLGAVFGAPIMSHATWAVVVRSLDTGERLYELNPDKLMMPASNMKVVTLAGAAAVLTWDHRFVTTVETSAPVEAGVLRGDLVVRGGGDPTINARNGRNAAVFAEWIGAIKAAGISRIDGRIVGDDQAFDDEGLGDGWAWDDLQYGYAAPVGALQYNEDSAELSVKPGAGAGDPAVVALTSGSGLTLVNRATTGPEGSPETIEYRRAFDRPVLEVTGIVPLAPATPPSPETPLRSVVRQVAVVNPTIYFVNAFREALVLSGIEVAGDPVDVDDVPVGTASAPPERRVLARSESPPLRDIAPVLMKVSQNLYAETLVKAVGAASGHGGSVRAGRMAIQTALRRWQIDDRYLVLADGSGLSRYNFLTAQLVGHILERMYSDVSHRGPFVASLPIAGKDGTISNRMRRTRAEGNAVAKTGSIANVRALSGYVRTRDGEMLLFSIIANDFVVPAATVNWIADLGVEVLANFTRQRPHSGPAAPK